MCRPVGLEIVSACIIHRAGDASRSVADLGESRQSGKLSVREECTLIEQGPGAISDAGLAVILLIREGLCVRKIIPSVEDVNSARREFVRREPRYLFYRVATELIALSLKEATTISLAEALCVLLQTWNRNYYRFKKEKEFEQHLGRIERLLESNRRSISGYRGRPIASFVSNEQDRVMLLFARFSQVLGPVGAAKCLHLLAPSFFPLWDQAIAKGYDLKLDGRATEKYVSFMRIAQDQCRVLQENGACWSDMLKAIDEFNYCTYTKPGPSIGSEQDPRSVEGVEKDIEVMTDGEVAEELTAMRERRRGHARQRAQERRNLLTELKRKLESGELAMDESGQLKLKVNSLSLSFVQECLLTPLCQDQ
jgi:hypothetical protein